MEGRVKLISNGAIYMCIDWNELVYETAAKRHIQEAFANADAFIDDEIELCLKCLYNNSKSHELINLLFILRSRFNVDSLALLEILRLKGIISESSINDVRNFKKARNLVLHSKEAEYALVLGHPEFKYSSQEELDRLTKEETELWLKQGLKIYDTLSNLKHIILNNQKKDKDFYWNTDYYKNYPLLKEVNRKYPKRKECIGIKV